MPTRSHVHQLWPTTNSDKLSEVITGTLGVDQSALTGESLEMDQGSGDLLYAGSVVQHGEAPGGHTYFGRTTELVQLARPKQHIELDAKSKGG
jgi:magnesium-transporting ATPase (P-type)